jgi:hypothetical protein
VCVSFPLRYLSLPPSISLSQLGLIIDDVHLPGKGTQCGLLVEKYNFAHLSAGDLLRAEQDRPDSQYGDLIRSCIREGNIVPMEVTVKLVENAMQDAIQSKSGPGWEGGKGRFLIDGFPRKMDQALKFEQTVRASPSAGFFFLVLFWLMSIRDYFRCARRPWCCFIRRTKRR